MFKKTALALMIAATLAPAAASAMSLPTLLPSVTYPDAPVTAPSTRGK